MIGSRRTRGLCSGLLFAVWICLDPATAGARGMQDDVDQAVSILNRFRALPERRIPARILRDAQGLAFLTVAKAGFLISARGGRGVVLSRTGRGWSPPSAVGTGGAGVGFQAGAQVTEFVLVLNTPAAVQAFASQGNVTLGAEISVAAGPVGRNLGAALTPRAAIYSYSRNQGAFAGISLEGTVIAARDRANARYFGRAVAPREILRGQVATPPGAGPLVRALNAHAPRANGRSLPPPRPETGPPDTR